MLSIFGEREQPNYGIKRSYNIEKVVVHCSRTEKNEEPRRYREMKLTIESMMRFFAPFFLFPRARVNSNHCRCRYQLHKVGKYKKEDLLHI